MPFCTFIKSYHSDNSISGALKVTVGSAGGTDISFAEIVQAAFPQVQVVSGDKSWGTLNEVFTIYRWDVQFVQGLRRFINLLKTHITIDDSLDESHALSPHNIPYEDDRWQRTQMGELVNRAKDYDGHSAWKNRASFEQICTHILGFINAHPRYNRANVIASAPSSNPAKTKTLPWAIADNVSGQLGKRLLIPIRLRSIPSQKDYDESEAGQSRTQIQLDTVTINENIEGTTVIVIDDLYESGATIREVTRACRKAGAVEVLGLAITKNAKFTQGMDLREWPWG